MKQLLITAIKKILWPTGFLCLLPLLLNAQTWQRTVKIPATVHSLEQVLSEIEKQTGVVFNYDRASLDLQQTIKGALQGPLSEVLPRLESLAGIQFRLTGNTFSIRKRTDSNIRGIVLSAGDEEPLPGASVIVKATGRVIIADSKGEFTFQPAGEDTLICRYVGMTPQEIIPGNRKMLKIYLQGTPLGMQEMVVTSSYTKSRRREEVVGSIVHLDVEALQVYRPLESIDKMLEGMAAGVYVATNTSLNTPVKVNVRGQGSLVGFGTNRTTSSQPLYVVDGMPVYEQQSGDQTSNFNNETYLNPLSSINPQDIASVTILKDAAAAAIYGANAANGVILITTKLASGGKTRFNVDYKTGVSHFINQTKYLNGPQYYEVLRETLINNGKTEALASSMAGSSTINTDWFALTNRPANYQQVNMDVEGGRGGTAFRFSAGYLKEQSSSLGNDLQKIYLRLRLDHEVNKKLSLTFNLSPSINRQNTMSIYGSVLMPPNISPYNEDGSFNELATFNIPNPVAVLAQNEDSHKGNAFTSISKATWKVLPAITVTGMFGADYYQNKETIYKSAKNATGRSVNSSLQLIDRSNLGWTSFIQGAYDKVFLQKHAVNFLLGTQAQDATTNLLSGQGSNFTFDRLRSLSYAGTQRSSSSSQSNATVSYYTQLSYDYAKKYYLTASARADKSSVFGGDKKVAVNAALGIGWTITKESFLPPGKALNFLRVRASYGSTGNSRIGSYSSRGLYIFGNDNYTGNTGSVPEGTSAPNPGLGWEKNYKLNTGIDATFFDRVQITAEYYNHHIVDLIANATVAPETGYTSMSVNSGTMRNQGFDLSINTTNIRSAHFQWNTSFNYGFNRNHIISFNKGINGRYSYAEIAAATSEGSSTSAIWGFKWKGVDPATGEELFYDRQGNTVDTKVIQQLPIDSGQVLGDRLPKFQGGIVNNISAYGFTLTFNIQYSFGASELSSYNLESDGRNLDHRNQSVNLIDRWQKPGDITRIPKLYFPRTVRFNSSRHVHDLTYIKLSNVSLHYNLPASYLKKLRLNRCSVFANASNLFYWYKEDSPPGRNAARELRFTYPEMSTYTFGITAGI